jgi:hypothetical protein
MGKTVNIEISEGKYQALQKMAKQAHTSISGMIEKLLGSLLPEEHSPGNDYKNDPLYKMEGSFNSGLGDLSINHDKYLYGK